MVAAGPPRDAGQRRRSHRAHLPHRRTPLPHRRAVVADTVGADAEDAGADAVTVAGPVSTGGFTDPVQPASKRITAAPIPALRTRAGHTVTYPRPAAVSAVTVASTAGDPPAGIPTRPGPPCATRATAPANCRTVRESTIRADLTDATAFATPGVATTATLTVVGNALGRRGGSGDGSTKQPEPWRRSTPGTFAFTTRPPRYGASDRPSSGSRTSRRSPTAPARHRPAVPVRGKGPPPVASPAGSKALPETAANPHTRRTAARRSSVADPPAASPADAKSADHRGYCLEQPGDYVSHPCGWVPRGGTVTAEPGLGARGKGFIPGW